MASKAKLRRQQRLERRIHSRHDNVIQLQNNVPQEAPEENTILERFIPKGEAQARYDNLIKTKDLVIVTGCAGTGKSHVPTANACIELRQKRIKEIIFTRPIVEASGGGKGIGYLKGGLDEKLLPYFLPLMKIMRKYLRKGELEYHMSHGTITFMPFEYMRGHTFEDAFVIGDELQNATVEQMELLLTRMGHNCKYVISGDTKQKDLASRYTSGLFDAVERFKDLPEVGHMHFLPKDIIRHDLVKKFIESYHND
jgi:phosphate starvation-inducible protein PhoH and related proteins